MKIVIVRHGDPDYVNDSLTEKGFVEAKCLQERINGLNADEFYCSPLGRARRTCETAMENMNENVTVLDWLMEFPGEILDPQTGRTRIPWDLMPSYWTKNKDLYDKDKWINTPVMQSATTHTKYKEVCEKLDTFLAEHGYVRNDNNNT